MSKSLPSFLAARKERSLRDLKSLKQGLNILSVLRVVLFGLALYFFYRAVEATLDYAILYGLISLLAFLRLLAFYLQRKEQRDYQEALLEELDLELAYLKERKLLRRPLDHQVPEAHPFARELNLYGPYSLHHHIDRSFSKSGALALAEDLKKTAFEGAVPRQDFIRELIADRERSFRMRALGKGLKNSTDLAAKISTWVKSPFTAIPPVLGILLLIALAAVWWRLYHLVLIPEPKNIQSFIYAVAFNLLLLLSRFPLIQKQQAALGQISEPMLAASKVLQELERSSYQSELATALKNRVSKPLSAAREIKRLSKFLGSLDQMANVVVLVLVNALFPYHLLRLRGLEKWQRSHGAALGDWLKLVDELQLYLSYANYCDHQDDFSWPTFQEQPGLIAEQLGHPLIEKEKRVCNDLDFSEQQLMILTGSNMSGKSTFLRTLGLNVLMAQKGIKVCAQRFETYPFQLLASMNPSDDLHDNRSYFQAEVLRLKMLSDKLNPQRFSLLILDEILRGTNSDDKKAGTRRFLKSIENKPCFGLIATHDVDIADLSEESTRFRPYYFESKVEGQELHFDYRLRPGVCRTPNANLLMQNYGLFDD